MWRACVYGYGMEPFDFNIILLFYLFIRRAPAGSDVKGKFRLSEIIYSELLKLELHAPTSN